jgi:transcriptional regulator GlxA family with amidase domain
MTPNDMDLKLSRSLDGCAPETVDLFARLLTDLTPIHSVRALAIRYGLDPVTLSSRFQRAKLPSPKRYVVNALLVRAAFLLDDPHRSLRAAALELGFSSAQAFGRTVTIYTGTPASVWRQDSGSGAHEFTRYIDELIAPYLATLRVSRLVGPLQRVRVPDGIRTVSA